MPSSSAADVGDRNIFEGIPTVPAQLGKGGVLDREGTYPGTSTYVDVRRRTSTYVDVLRRTSTYVDVRRRTSTYVYVRLRTSTYVDVRPRTSTSIHVRRRTSTYVDVRRRTSTYVDVRRRTSTKFLELIWSQLVANATLRHTLRRWISNM